MRPIQTHRAQLLANLRKQVGAGGQEQHHGLGPARLDPALEAFIVARLGQVHAAVVQQLREAVKFLRAWLFGGLHFKEALADELAVLGVAAFFAGHSENATVGRQLVVPPGLKEGGHQLAPGEVTGAAEQDQIERHEALLQREVQGRKDVTKLHFG